MGQCDNPSDDIEAVASQAYGLYFAPRTMRLADESDGTPRHLGYVEIYFNGVTQEPADGCSAGFFATRERAMMEAIALGNRLLRMYSGPADEG